ncbi:hypothetical protein SAMN05216420_10248 [Nitrosospira sp. Nl5]|uniref:DUF5996 family protein n=1 Tax=Nitrosospira sp. Nl5 TaxID=200120 RepID=UPI000891B9C0|nr:DUF5996 family protein [Nitrosospira sp. Nl5]SCY02659.1 hypothetical protein SAMN05216420_10248 [Nitrosospira sp. Nl5]
MITGYTTYEQNEWPRLPPLEEWQQTCDTLHMWAQVVGKIRLTLSPDINHSWGSTLYVTTRGLTTSPIPYGMLTFAIDFDFIAHTLNITTSRGTSCSFALEPMPVSGFYRKIMQALRELGIEIRIFARPVEVEVAIPFEKDDQHASYDADAAFRFWHALVQADRVFKEFRAHFIGKVSPVHFFWGAFDLAVTRFSGRTAPKHPGGAPNVAPRIMEEAYSHEVSSAGFWPGAGLGEAAFYSYAYPSPTGFDKYPVQPEAAYFHAGLGEFILPYEAVRIADNPPHTLLQFLQSTYEAAATLATWDRPALEQKIPGVTVPQPI